MSATESIRGRGRHHFCLSTSGIRPGSRSFRKNGAGPAFPSFKACEDLLYDRIVTHDDFDGVVSAAMVGYFLEIEKISFAGPGDIANSRISTGASDIVCDLPYPLECGMWFDHHEANLEDVALRGIEQESIPGLRRPAPSCARVILDYFENEFEIDRELVELAEATGAHCPRTARSTRRSSSRRENLPKEESSCAGWFSA